MPPLPTTATVDKPRQWGYDAALSSLLLRLATAPDRQLQIVTAPSETQRIQTQQTAEDYLPEFGDVFSRNNFTGGSGLDFAHRTNGTELDVTRYWDSKGIDISVTKPGELDGVTLLKDTEQLVAETATNLHLVRLPDDTVIYAEGSQVSVIADPNDLNPAISPEDPHTGTADIEGLAALGSEVYAACGTDGTARRSSGGTWSDLGAAATYGIWAVKGRLIGDNGAGAVVEIDETTGAHTTLATVGSTDTVTSVVDAGPVILVALSTGTILAFADNAGTLDIVNQTTLTSSDIVRCMAWSNGVLILGTEASGVGRLWRAIIGTSEEGYTITTAQLLREFTYVPRAAAAVRDRIYVAVRDSATEVALWRYQLATAGLARDFVYAATADPVGVVQGGTRLFCTVAGEGVYRDVAEYLDSGYLISPIADHFSPVRKTWVGLRVQAEDIGSGSSIDLYVTTEPSAILDPAAADWILVGRITESSQVGTELVLPALRGRYAAVQAVLNGPAGGGATPKLISFALRSYSDSEDVIIQMPVNISDWIERPNHRPFRVQGWGRRVYDALLGLDGDYVTLELYRPPLVVKGVIESVQAPIFARGERGSATAYALVQVRGRIVGAGTGGTGQGTLGVALLGVDLLGV